MRADGVCGSAATTSGERRRLGGFQASSSRMRANQAVMCGWSATGGRAGPVYISEQAMAMSAKVSASPPHRGGRSA